MNKEFNNICEECKKEDESVSQNLIKLGYKMIGSGLATHANLFCCRMQATRSAFSSFYPCKLTINVLKLSINRLTNT